MRIKGLHFALMILVSLLMWAAIGYVAVKIVEFVLGVDLP